MPKKNADGAKAPPSHYEHVIRPVDSLIGYVRNARTHSASQIDMVAASIRQFGFTNPCLIDENNNLIAGHCRLDAAKKLKMQEVPCIVVTGLSESARRALVLADNQIAAKAGGWDNEMLLMELGDIAEDGEIPLETIGFSQNEMDQLLGLASKEDEPPKETDENFASQFAVMVICKNEPDQERIYNELASQGYSIRVVNT